MAKFTRHKKLALIFIAPQLLITLLFFIWPACSALIQSFFFSDAFGLNNRFAGLANFFDLLNAPGYGKAVFVTVVIGCFVTLLTMSFGLFLAVLVQSRTKSQQIYKTLFLWPYAVAPAVAALLWRFLCQPTIGWFAHGLQSIGIHFNYLINSKQALLVVIVTASWQQFSYNFLFFFAALKAIPASLIEAAMIDGASAWQRFWHIIVPLLSPTTFFLLVMNLIYAFFDTFSIIDIMTNGGPGGSTTTLIYKVYKDGFVGMDPGSLICSIGDVDVDNGQFYLNTISLPGKKGALRMRFLNHLLIHGLLCFAIAGLFIPLYLAVVAASHDGAAMMQAPLPIWPGTAFFHNLKTVLTEGLVATGGQPVWQMLLNSLVMAILIASGKIMLALGSAFALVYFEFPLQRFCFAVIFSTMMLPVEVRIVPTFQVIASFAWLNTFAGLTLPLMASATATFLFRQFFKTVPKELVDAAKLDGAGPLRFFLDILLPLSKTQIAALFIILFVYGWNQYLWPLVITTDASMATIVMGIRYLAGVADQIPQWHYIMVVALIALFPPCLVVITMQRWFEKGLMH